MTSMSTIDDKAASTVVITAVVESFHLLNGRDGELRAIDRCSLTCWFLDWRYLTVQESFSVTIDGRDHIYLIHLCLVSCASHTTHERDSFFGRRGRV